MNDTDPSTQPHHNQDHAFDLETTKHKRIVWQKRIFSFLVIALALGINVFNYVNRFDEGQYQNLVSEIVENDRTAVAALTVNHSSLITDYIQGLEDGFPLYERNLQITREIEKLPKIEQYRLDINRQDVFYTNLRIRQFTILRDSLKSGNDYLNNAELIAITNQIEDVTVGKNNLEYEQIRFKSRIVAFAENELAANIAPDVYERGVRSEMLPLLENSVSIWQENQSILERIEADGYALDLNRAYLDELATYASLRLRQFEIIRAGVQANDPSYSQDPEFVSISRQIEERQN